MVHVPRDSQSDDSRLRGLRNRAVKALFLADRDAADTGDADHIRTRLGADDAAVKAGAFVAFLKALPRISADDAAEVAEALQRWSGRLAGSVSVARFREFLRAKDFDVQRKSKTKQQLRDAEGPSAGHRCHVSHSADIASKRPQSGGGSVVPVSSCVCSRLLPSLRIGGLRLDRAAARFCGR